MSLNIREGMVLNSFSEIDLISPVQRALTDEGYVTPTPIQTQTIPAAMDGRDVLGSAQTGTGKTAAFALPILSRLGAKQRKAISRRPFALVLAPTRELAVQIGESFSTYGRHLRLRHALVYGGVGQRNQVRTLNRGAHVLIATPGRLIDLMNQGFIELDRLETFVLDEADRMLDMGFLPDLKRIISELPEERQSLFFSATLPPKIVELAQNLLRDPVTVNVIPESTNLETIEQKLFHVDRKKKMSALLKLLSHEENTVEQAIVFTKTKRMADQVKDDLIANEIRSTAIHGNKSQNARERALHAFRSKRVRVLVATDVAARGIDIDGLSHVINYDLPLEAEAYVHRIGRTGRAGAEGVAISFCSSDEFRLLYAIEREIGQKIDVDPDYPAPERRPRGAGNGGKRRRRGGGENQGGDSRPPRRKFSGPKKPWERRRGEGGAEGEASTFKPRRKRKPGGPGQKRRPEKKSSS